MTYSASSFQEDVEEVSNSLRRSDSEKRLRGLLDDKDFLYRIDNLRSMRSLLKDPTLRPKRWDAYSEPWRHESLLSARALKTDQEGIYRISFWSDPDAAWRDLQCRGLYEPHLLTRVHKSVVEKVFSGWRHEEDDSLPGEASLIWTCCPVDDHGEGFYNGGVPVDQLEVLDGSKWTSWNDATSLLPDQVRLTRQGWQPIGMWTRQGGPVLAYWLVVKLPQDFDSAGKKHWLLLTLDETARGTLGTEDSAIARAIRDLLTGPLNAISGDIGGVMTLYPSRDKLWTEVFEVSVSERELDSWWMRFLSNAMHMPPQYEWTVSLGHLLTADQQRSLIRESRLKIAKPEFPDSIWK